MEYRGMEKLARDLLLKIEIGLLEIMKERDTDILLLIIKIKSMCMQISNIMKMLLKFNKKVENILAYKKHSA